MYYCVFLFSNLDIQGYTAAYIVHTRSIGEYDHQLLAIALSSNPTSFEKSGGEVA